MKSVEVDGWSETTKEYLGFFKVKIIWEDHKNLKKIFLLDLQGKQQIYEEFFGLLTMSCLWCLKQVFSRKAVCILVLQKDNCP